MGRWVTLSSAMGFWCSARSGAPKEGACASLTNSSSGANLPSNWSTFLSTVLISFNVLFSNFITSPSGFPFSFASSSPSPFACSSSERAFTSFSPYGGSSSESSWSWLELSFSPSEPSFTSSPEAVFSFTSSPEAISSFSSSPEPVSSFSSSPGPLFSVVGAASATTLNGSVISAMSPFSSSPSRHPSYESSPSRHPSSLPSIHPSSLPSIQQHPPPSFHSPPSSSSPHFLRSPSLQTSLSEPLPPLDSPSSYPVAFRPPLQSKDFTGFYLDSHRIKLDFGNYGSSFAREERKKKRREISFKLRQIRSPNTLRGFAKTDSFGLVLRDWFVWLVWLHECLIEIGLPDLEAPEVMTPHKIAYCEKKIVLHETKDRS
ncbi:hypothetical protein HID58_034200 [Brassica napus]|uniref:Uncharacterized protein n=1 Tax=Brassica napus TaxID=3708 RepID=A0ABQ8C1C8_BRANA|nr:hypothetical protein HID58_034200 [Brassica napus]